MAVWSSNNIMLTEKGIGLLALVQSGKGQLTITKVETGGGRATTSKLPTLTSVVDFKQRMTVAKVTAEKDGSNLELQVSNLSLTQEYSIEQIGVYAYHPDTGEILYMIAQCDEGTSDVFPLPTVTPITMSYKFYLVHGSAENLNITVDPAGLTKLSDFRELCDFVGYGVSEYNSVYGVEVDYENRTYKRLGASVGLTPSDFDNIAPWGGRRRCAVDEDGKVIAYLGENGYVTQDGDKIDEASPLITVKEYAQIMVEQPKFWYKTVPVKTEKIEGQEGYSLCKARYYISPIPQPGFKLFPLFARGIPLREADVAYLPAYQGSVFSVSDSNSSEYTLSITAVASKSGSIDLILETYGPNRSRVEETNSIAGDYMYSIPVTDTDTAEDIVNKLVEISKEPRCKWTIEKQSVGTVTIKTNLVGLALTPMLNYNDTGVRANIQEIKKGTGYFTRSDAGGTNFSIDTGDRLFSVAGSKPASGLYQNLTRKNASILAKNNYNSKYEEGFGWQQKDLSAFCCTAWLHLIEYATLDCQSTIGKGVSSKWDYTNYSWINDVNSTGHTGEAKTNLGNASGMSTVIATGDGYNSVSYRGEENPWGNISFWIDGLNIYYNSTKKKFSAYYSTTGIYTDDVGEEREGYRNVGFSLSNTKGYVDRVGYSEHFDWGFLPTRATGSNNYPTHDGFSYMTSSGSITEGWSVAYSENGAGNGNNNGLCSLGVGRSSSYSTRHIGCSLIFVPEHKDSK